MKLLDLLFPKPAKKAKKSAPKPAPRVTIRKVEPEPPAEDIILNDYGDFRRAGDPPNIIRVDDDRPKGFPKKLFNYISVAGVSYRQDNVIAFINGHDRRLSLRREFVNEQHPNALAVYGLWQDNAGEHTALLGYVPREANDAIGDRPVAATLEAMFLASDGRDNAGLKIDIWTIRDRK